MQEPFTWCLINPKIFVFLAESVENSWVAAAKNGAFFSHTIQFLVVG